MYQVNPPLSATLPMVPLFSAQPPPAAPPSSSSPGFFAATPAHAPPGAAATALAAGARPPPPFLAAAGMASPAGALLGDSGLWDAGLGESYVEGPSPSSSSSSSGKSHGASAPAGPPHGVSGGPGAGAGAGLWGSGKARRGNDTSCSADTASTAPLDMDNSSACASDDQGRIASTSTSIVLSPRAILPSPGGAGGAGGAGGTDMFAGLGFYSPGLALTGSGAGAVRPMSKSIRRAALESVGGGGGGFSSANADSGSSDANGVHGSSTGATRSSRRRNV